MIPEPDFVNGDHLYLPTKRYGVIDCGIVFDRTWVQGYNDELDELTDEGGFWEYRCSHNNKSNGWWADPNLEKRDPIGP